MRCVDMLFCSCMFRLFTLLIVWFQVDDERVGLTAASGKNSSNSSERIKKKGSKANQAADLQIGDEVHGDESPNPILIDSIR